MNKKIQILTDLLLLVLSVSAIVLIASIPIFYIDYKQDKQDCESDFVYRNDLQRYNQYPNE